MLSPSRPSLASSPRAAGKDQKDYIHNLIGPARVVNVRAAAKDLVRINEAPNETGFTSCRHDSTYRVVTSLS
jgi:hypothetical protein